MTTLYQMMKPLQYRMFLHTIMRRRKNPRSPPGFECRPCFPSHPVGGQHSYVVLWKSFTSSTNENRTTDSGWRCFIVPDQSECQEKCLQGTSWYHPQRHKRPLLYIVDPCIPFAAFCRMLSTTTRKTLR